MAMSIPPLSIVRNPSSDGDVKIGDVVDLQTLESESPFFGVTVTTLNETCLIITPELPRAVRNYGKFPILIPWHAVSWIRLGTGESSFTDPADDPPDSDEYGYVLGQEYPFPFTPR